MSEDRYHEDLARQRADLITGMYAETLASVSALAAKSHAIAACMGYDVTAYRALRQEDREALFPAHRRKKVGHSDSCK